jgi:5-methylcytosine-specific restriction protein A
VRVCLGCGTITEKRRCQPCQSKYEASRQRADYGGAWRKLVEQAIRAHPWCTVCRSTEDLTGDHIVPHRAGGRDERGNVQVLCRGCNSRKGGRLESRGAV